MAKHDALTIDMPGMAARRIRSYVRREGRMTSGQHRALQAHWTRYGLAIEDGMLDRSTCFARPGNLVVEIGFGMGDSLAETAGMHGEENFIGVEVHRPGVGHLLNLAAENDLDNLKVYNADSVDVFARCIPPESVDRIQVFFPDPWHKKRHHKRRLLTGAFTGVLADRLAAGGILHVATDWPDYAESIAASVAGTTSLQPVSPPARPVTKYERRGIALDHEVIDLAWIKRR